MFNLQLPRSTINSDIVVLASRRISAIGGYTEVDGPLYLYDVQKPPGNYLDPIYITISDTETVTVLNTGAPALPVLFGGTQEPNATLVITNLSGSMTYTEGIDYDWFNQYGHIFISASGAIVKGQSVKVSWSGLFYFSALGACDDGSLLGVLSQVQSEAGSSLLLWVKWDILTNTYKEIAPRSRGGSVPLLKPINDLGNYSNDTFSHRVYELGKTAYGVGSILNFSLPSRRDPYFKIYYAEWATTTTTTTLVPGYDIYSGRATLITISYPASAGYDIKEVTLTPVYDGSVDAKGLSMTSESRTLYRHVAPHSGVLDRVITANNKTHRIVVSGKNGVSPQFVAIPLSTNATIAPVTISDSRLSTYVSSLIGVVGIGTKFYVIIEDTTTLQELNLTNGTLTNTAFPVTPVPYGNMRAITLGAF